MRLIDADDIVNTLGGTIEVIGYDGKNLLLRGQRIGLNSAIKQIKNAPTIEAEPIIHAHWERDVTFDGFKVWKCSNCACRFNYISTEWGLSPVTYAYGIRCGHCGAVMDK